MELEVENQQHLSGNVEGCSISGVVDVHSFEKETRVVPVFNTDVQPSQSVTATAQDSSIYNVFVNLCSIVASARCLDPNSLL